MERPAWQPSPETKALITIVRYMLGRLAIITAALAVLIAVEQILRKSLTFYDLVVTGTLPFSELLSIWLHVLPVIFYHATPEIVALGMACRYQLWIENNELLALQSAGRSRWQIAAPGMIIAALGAVFCAVNSLYLVPLSWTKIEEIRLGTTLHPRITLLEPGYEREIAPGVSIVFSGRGDSSTTLESILIRDSRDRQALRDIWAHRARVFETREGSFLSLEKGFYIVRAPDKVDIVDFADLWVPLDFAIAGPKRARQSGFYEEPVIRLIDPPAAIRADPLLAAEWITEGHRRIINPPLCFGTAVLVLGLLLVGRPNRTGQRLRFVLAVASGLATNTLPGPIVSMALRNLELLPFLYLLPVAPAGIGALLLGISGWPQLRARRPRRTAACGEAQPVVPSSF